MNPILIGLTVTAIGLLIELLVLDARNPKLRATEQAYKFHELRDRLQILMVEGKIDARSVAHQFLILSLNLAIKNAGVMSLTQILKLSRAVKRNADEVTFQHIIEDVHRQGVQVQKLYDEFFQALVVMLISNDRLTKLMFALAKFGAKAVNRAVIRVIASVGKSLFPKHTEAVSEARQYQRWGRRVHALSY